MKLQNFVLFFPAAISAFVLKSIKTKTNDELKQYIEDNGMYHITSSEAAEKIIESGKIKASKSLLNSYGLPASYMFAGIPDINSYQKNCTNGAYDNILLHPEKIVYAVKLNATKNDLANFKVRNFQDGAIVHEGDCILKDEQVEIKQLILDLIIDKNGEKKIGLRERTKEEIEQDSNNRNPEFLEALENEKSKRGYHKNNFLFLNSLNTISQSVETEINLGVNGLKKLAKTGFNGLKNLIANIKNGKTKEIEENIVDQATRTIKAIEQGDISTKRPVRSEKYVKTITTLNKEGIRQKSLSDVIGKLQKSDLYQYLTQKEATIDKEQIRKYGIHGINHNNRVAMLATAIMNEEKMQLDKKNFDILISACYYHDIGRIGDIGPHAGRSARKVKKMELTTLDGEEYTDEDKRMLQFLVNAHEGNPNKEKRLLKKYKIPEEKTKIAQVYSAILKDADALDRARLSNQLMMDLDAKYLRMEGSKSLIDFSYGLEALSRKVDIQKVMHQNVEEQNIIQELEHGKKQNEKEFEFFDEMKELVNEEIVIENKKDEIDTRSVDSRDGIDEVINLR